MPASSEATAFDGKSTTVRSSTLARAFGAAIRSVDRVAPELAVRWTRRLFLTPRRHRLPERERLWLDGAERGEIRFGDGRLATWSWGEGPPVVLVHGWEGRGAQLGAFVRPLADAGFRVVAFDGPAHGASSGRTTNLLEMSEAIRAVVASLAEPAAVVAHSFGAAATTVALRRPLAIASAVYLSPAEEFDHFTAIFGATLGLPAPLVLRMQRSIEHRFTTPWSTLRGREIAPRLRLPLLVVHDRDDAEVPAEHGERLVASWPGAHAHFTRGLGHRRILRDPQVVERAVAHLRAPVAPLVAEKAAALAR